MTRVILITNKSDVTCDFIVKRLTELQIPFYRFNTEELTRSVFVSLNFMTGEFNLFDNHFEEKIDLKSFTAVYYRRPELPDIDRTELNSGELDFVLNEILITLEGIYKIMDSAFWISPVFSIRQAENKPYQLLTAKKIGFKIPDSIITNNGREFNTFLSTGEKIIKPVKSGLIGCNDEDRVIFTTKLKETNVDDVLISPCPQFLQQNIEKRADVRVTVVGKKTFAVLINSQVLPETTIDWRRGEHSLEHEILKIPDSLSKKCVDLVEVLNLRFGAIDFVLDRSNEYYFLEINPNGQWAWIENQTGLLISHEIVNYLVHEKN